jgi:hypothetical protein
MKQKWYQCNQDIATNRKNVPKLIGEAKLKEDEHVAIYIQKVMVMSWMEKKPVYINFHISQ